jgi:hypothetical protein
MTVQPGETARAACMNCVAHTTSVAEDDKHNELTTT